MKPKNFPDRVERRRRGALNRLEAQLQDKPEHMISKRAAAEYEILGTRCSDRRLRPQDINCREAAGDRRKPGAYKGGLSRG